MYYTYCVHQSKKDKFGIDSVIVMTTFNSIHLVNEDTDMIYMYDNISFGFRVKKLN